MVFNFYFDKIYVYKKVTTVVQFFYVDSLGVHLFIDTYLLSFVLLFSRFYYSDQGQLQSPGVLLFIVPQVRNRSVPPVDKRWVLFCFVVFFFKVGKARQSRVNRLALHFDRLLDVGFRGNC